MKEIILKLLLLTIIVHGIYILFIFFKYFVYLKLFVRFLKKPVDLKGSGQWAVVTGCTDGIGRAFTFELAKIGMDVVLISRSEIKLRDLAAQLSGKYSVKTEIIVADFSNTNKVIPEIERKLNDLNIGVLVNNVGVSTGVSPFLENDKNEVLDLIEINVKATTRMCSIVLPVMVMKRKGVIINVSSLTAVLPAPEFTSYAASKAYIKKLSTELNKEYKSFGVTVHCLTTGFVGTKMSNIPTESTIIPTPNTYAESALKTIGLSDVTTGFWYHDFFECSSILMIEISKQWYLSWCDKATAKYKEICHPVSTARRKTMDENEDETIQNETLQSIKAVPT